jgi:hypothetical protein
MTVRDLEGDVDDGEPEAEQGHQSARHDDTGAGARPWVAAIGYGSGQSHAEQ